MGRRLRGRRQRRAPRSVHGQRPHLSRRRPPRPGHALPAAQTAVPEPRRRRFQRRHRRGGRRPADRAIEPRRRVRRLRQRRRHRRAGGQHERSADAAPQRHRRRRPLDHAAAGGRRRATASAIGATVTVAGGRAHADGGGAERRQLSLAQRSARALRAGRGRPRRPASRSAGRAVWWRRSEGCRPIASTWPARGRGSGRSRRARATPRRGGWKFESFQFRASRCRFEAASRKPAALLPQHARNCPVLEAGSELGFLVYPPLEPYESFYVGFYGEGRYQFVYYFRTPKGDWTPVFTVRAAFPVGASAWSWKRWSS